ncbi:DNA-3-methyladenine glycosylase I [Desulfosarcina cetonica]|uniref:DNA-3-methyladenine glycosylase I n=1 Tax=Desulfosarcina cetonica TaxID=90730 RepID=UPI0006D0F03C|nr:DNA-3-methyladenine glycosylase I [Desulfosarcina cetonica]VTR70693.1 DNA-3-methyladenine glycosylase I [Desulfosarcina cetonica]
MSSDSPVRCPWPGDDPRMIAYHDTEWGVPVHDDRKWFEFIILDAFQAGLSWRTILHRREAFRMVFHDFDPQRVARITDTEMARAMQNPAIIRNRLKIRATVTNAHAFLNLQEAHGSFDAFIWTFTDGRVIQNHWHTPDAVPATTALSDTVSKALKQKGFTFVGSTICYALLQAAGMVNDHLTGCFRHRELGGS